MHSKKVSGILCLFFLSIQSIWASPLDSLGIENDKDRIYVIHQVEAKETLYSLSKRYRTTVAGIIENNQISGANLALGSVLRIPWEHGITHEVHEGETLFSIAKQYKLTVENLKNQNQLTSDEVKLGQKLIILVEAPVKRNAPTEKPIGDFHVVDENETLYSISRKYQVELSDLKSWNGLADHNVQSGDTLWLSGSKSSRKVEASLNSTSSYTPEVASQLVPSENETVITASEDKVTVDIMPVKENGVAAVIDGNSDTQKYLALHPTAPVGTIMRVRNEMTNLSVFVRVVGKLPKIGANNNVLIRLSPPAQQALGALDNKFRVELSYVPNQ